MQYEQFGHFSDDGLEFTINTPQPPRPWLNYLWNDQYLAIVSQTGQGRGVYQDTAGRRTDLVQGARMIYLRDADSGEFWTANAGRVDDHPKPFDCTVGLGYQIIGSSQQGIASQWRTFVPREDPCEIWTVTLRNDSADVRHLNAFLYFDTAIQGSHEGSFPAAHAHFDEDVRAIKGSNVVRFGSWYSHETVGRTVDGFFTVDADLAGCDCRRLSFLGRYGDLRGPQAVLSGACGNSVCEFDPICFALQVNLELQPGESRTINAIAGPLKDNDEIAALRGKYFADGAVEEEFRTVREYFDHATDGVDIHTPDETLNVFVNHWLKHQLLFNATWARVYFNGVRDLLQDADNISIFGADHARATLRKVLSHQYESGYAPRAWIEGQLVEQDYSDSPVWITFTVASLVKETGDLTLLNEEVPFWEGESAEVYEHCRRSLEYLWADRGEHGLSKIHSGDWNDIMNGVGADGDGQSVWLSMALHRALLQFAELAEMIGRSDDADDALTRARQLAEAINTDGWDGEYYLRAFTDDGKPIGTSIENQCFLNPQAWSVISGTAAEERARKAMQAVDEKLERDIGILTVAEPFTEFRKDVGFISATRPGTNVNGGVYVHASTFKMIADCMLDRTEEAYRTLQKILPFSEARDQQTGEPYVVPNAYFAPPSGERYGEAGDGWFTGSAGWLLKGIVAHIFGLQPEADGLHIRPCMPKQWQTSSITRVFRGATYHVTYSPARSADEPAITVDNEPLQSEVLPCEKGQNYRVHVAL